MSHYGDNYLHNLGHNLFLWYRYNTHSIPAHWRRGRREFRELTTYDLVSRGTNTSGINQCNGTYNDTALTGWGPGYQYNCVHSGLIKTSGDISTTWYNYPLATAGTIIDENTSPSNPAINTITATESICPKGWTLPNHVQISSQRNITMFSPVAGGRYTNAVLFDEEKLGFWWGSEAYGDARRLRVNYDNSNSGKLQTGSGARHYGLYIRCVQKS